jgi:hypothetical protein
VAGELPSDIRDFIDSHIDSVEQVEALVLMRADPKREWTAEEMAKSLYTSPESASARLGHLHRKGLLSEVRSDAVRYRYEQRTPRLRKAVEDFVEIYAQRKVAVINQIFSGAPDDVQSFADAFRFRREQDD